MFHYLEIDKETHSVMFYFMSIPPLLHITVLTNCFVVQGQCCPICYKECCMSIRTVAKSLTGSLEDVLSITTVISDGIGITKSYISEVRAEQELGKAVRLSKFRDELKTELIESKIENKAKLANLADEYQMLNTPEVNEKIEALLKGMGSIFTDSSADEYPIDY